MVSVGKGEANMENEKDWTVLKCCLLVVFLAYIAIYAVEAV